MPMPTMLALMLQASAAPAPDPAGHEPVSRDRGCVEDPARAGDIIVCGAPDNEQYRLRPIARPPGMKADPDGPGIGINAAGGMINLYTSSEATTGVPDKRVMVRVRLPF